MKKLSEVRKPEQPKRKIGGIVVIVVLLLIIFLALVFLVLNTQVSEEEKVSRRQTTNPYKDLQTSEDDFDTIYETIDYID